MSRLTSRIDPSSPAFARNQEKMAGLVEHLVLHTGRAALGGSAESRQRHESRGKLLPRARVEALLDPGSPFLELSALAANGLYGEDIPGAGLITGIGHVCGLSGDDCLQ